MSADVPFVCVVCFVQGEGDEDEDEEEEGEDVTTESDEGTGVEGWARSLETAGELTGDMRLERGLEVDEENEEEEGMSGELAQEGLGSEVDPELQLGEEQDDVASELRRLWWTSPDALMEDGGRVVVWGCEKKGSKRGGSSLMEVVVS